MKKLFFLLFGLSLFINSCSKSSKCEFSDTNATASAAEITHIQDYLTANSITATQHSSGIFYHVDDPGTGNTASICSNITVNYTGTLLSNGTVFYSNNSGAGVSFVLGQLIAGWQKGLPLIKSGGQITLYIPPSLGYGAYDRTNEVGVVVIPGNSYLKFSIHLLDVQ